MIRMQLASVLRSIISQRLVPRADGKGRVAALEILRNSSRVRELVENPDRTQEIGDAIAKGNVTAGTQTFDQSVMQLFRAKLITYKEALRQASNPDDFALRVSGISATSDSSWDGFEGERPAAEPVAAAPAPAAPAAPAPPAAPAEPKREGDDFKIERF
jgi:twitching motility protein PilT